MLNLFLFVLSTLGAAAAPVPTLTSHEAVREELRHAWQGYVKYAWGHDELRPLSRGYQDWYAHSLLMTPVDALDTMLLMGLEVEAEQAKELITSQLSFDQDQYVSVFETTIRLLGGLLSSYELTLDPRLLSLARDLGDRLLPAFNTRTGMPWGEINLKTGKGHRSLSCPAEVGSLVLEFGTLSKLTGNPIYFDKAKRAMVELYRRTPKRGLFGHGLPGNFIDVQSGKWKKFWISHVGGRIDSYFEYLYKAWLLFGDEDFLRMWQTTISAINRHLADNRHGELWYGRAEMHLGWKVQRHYGALEAFFAGLLALSGDLDRARRLQDSNYRMWMQAGIEPEEYDYACHKIVVPSYQLRPEAIESAWYLYELTGEEKYQQQAREFFESLVRECRTDAGYAELSDVRTGAQADSMQSFFLAETLKYAWLALSPRHTIDLERVVFNTEAHPLRRFW